MSGFEERWRTLARAAGRTTAPPPLAPPRRQVEAWMVRGRSEAAHQGRTPARRLPGWALPAAVLVLLYALALPVSGRAWTNTRALENPLTLVPRPPAVPPPPVPSPPPVPPPPLRGSTDWLDSLMKEMHP